MIDKFNYDKYFKEFDVRKQVQNPNQEIKAAQWEKSFSLNDYGKTYPWSILRKCKCGNKKPWMYGFKPYSEAITDRAIYRVVCRRCFRHTHKGTYHEVVKEWNSN